MATASTFEFIEQGHEYRENGVRYPSVTQIIADAGLVDFSMVSAEVMENKRFIGTEVHKACQLIDEEGLTFEQFAEQFDYPAEVEGYIRGWVKFKADVGFSPRLIEHRGIGTVNGMKIGYTVDREGTVAMNGKDWPHIVEIKCTAAPEKSWSIQLALYDMVLGKDKVLNGGNRQRVAIQLKPEGVYKVHPFTDPSDYGVAAAMLAVYHWKERNGYAKKG